MSIKIKDLPLNERPRERLLYWGVEKLSNEELLSILLKVGTRNLSVKQLSEKILKEAGGMEHIRELTYEKLSKIKGIGHAKACVLLAAFEFSKRIEQPVLQKIDGTEELYRYFKQECIGQKQEHFYCVYLDNNNQIINKKLLFIGTLNQSLVHPREVFKEAYSLSASSIICVHNHPSGNIVPSENDLHLTQKLVEIGQFLGIRILDHMIIGGNSYYSFLENGKI